jgi:hypothetical protein
MIEVIPLDSRIPQAWALIPAFLERVRQFVLRYEPDESPDFLCAEVRRCFAADDYGRRGVAVLNDGRMVGHVLLMLEEHAGQRWLTIQQYEVDKGSGVTREIADYWLDAFCKLARELKAKQVRARVQGDARARAFKRYGFKPFAVLLARDIGDSDGRDN